MKSLTFSIDSQAPMQDEIDAARASANQALKDAERRERLSLLVNVFLAIPVLQLLYYAYQYGPGAEGGAYAVAIGVFVASMVCFFGVPLGFTVSYLAALAFEFAALLHLPDSRGLLVPLIVGAIGSGIAFTWHDKRVTQVELEASETLKSMTTLNFTEHPKELVEFVDLATSDADIRAYQHQIASMGRLPVLGEFYAAKQWCSTAEARRTLQAQVTQANEALAKLACPI